jgi:Cysteine-rich secretory protein family
MSFAAMLLAAASASAPHSRAKKHIPIRVRMKSVSSRRLGKQVAPTLFVPATSVPAAAAPVVEPVGPSFEDRILAAHNIERQSVGQPPLRWSVKLEAGAKAWADHQAATSTFEHADEVPGQQPQGETLWMGTKDAYSPEQMVGAWIDEKKLFKPGFFPNVSTTGNWVDVGHYSQVIWYKTVEIGCAKAANQKDDYLVCRYFPSGNWDAENPLGPNGGKR